MKNAKQSFLDSILKEGEKYAGIILGKNGEPDYHLILLPGDADKVTWKAAKDFADSMRGRLPRRCEQALLFANLKKEFKDRWYWSGEQPATNSNFAWSQYFNGSQVSNHTSWEGRARAVRSITIEFV